MNIDSRDRLRHHGCGSRRHWSLSPLPASRRRRSRSKRPHSANTTAPPGFDPADGSSIGQPRAEFDVVDVGGYPVAPLLAAHVGGEFGAQHLRCASAGQSRTILSALAEASRCPSGLNATPNTAPVWPVSGRRDADRFAGVGDPTAAPCCRRSAEASRCPSGLNATLVTAPVWPVSGSPTGWPVSASHSRTVLSSPAEASRCPSGLNATLVHRAGVAGERVADRLAGVGVPQPHRAVVAGGGQPVPVGAERHTEHRAGVAGERVADGWPVVGVPQPHRAVGAGRGQPVPVRAERHTGHRAGVAGERVADRLAGVGVPQPHRVVAAAGGQPVPVGAERHTRAPRRCGRSAGRRSAGRCRGPTAAPCCPRRRRRAGARPG